MRAPIAGNRSFPVDQEQRFAGAKTFQIRRIAKRIKNACVDTVGDITNTKWTKRAECDLDAGVGCGCTTSSRQLHWCEAID